MDGLRSMVCLIIITSCIVPRYEDSLYTSTVLCLIISCLSQVASLLNGSCIVKTRKKGPPSIKRFPPNCHLDTKGLTCVARTMKALSPGDEAVVDYGEDATRAMFGHKSLKRKTVVSAPLGAKKPRRHRSQEKQKAIQNELKALKA